MSDFIKEVEISRDDVVSILVGDNNGFEQVPYILAMVGDEVQTSSARQRQMAEAIGDADPSEKALIRALAASLLEWAEE